MISGSRAGGFRRHLEGWPLGVWVIFVCGLSALLVVPRDVPPELVPPPRIDRGAPLVGQHSREVLLELGASAERIDGLFESGAVAGE